ncbi:MAG: chemotaxis protein CheX [Magnetococcales bacterium]|nr:chemotaxis protein CheX [Magnetococcales bacterium]
MRPRKPRYPLFAKAELLLPDGRLLPLATRNLSLSGLLVEGARLAESLLDKLCVLKLLFHPEAARGWEGDPLVLEFQCRVARLSNDHLGLAMVGMEADRYTSLDGILEESGHDPELLLERLRRHARLRAEEIDITLLKETLGGFIVRAVEEIFETMLTLPLTTGAAWTSLPDASYHPPEAEVSALVTFNGVINGGIHLFTTRELAVALAQDLAGTPIRELNDEAKDGFGELANMVAGGVQTGLSVDFERINLTPPTLVIGHDYQMAYKSGSHSVKQVFHIPGGSFCVECFFT